MSAANPSDAAQFEVVLPGFAALNPAYKLTTAFQFPGIFSMLPTRRRSAEPRPLIWRRAETEVW